MHSDTESLGSRNRLTRRNPPFLWFLGSIPKEVLRMLFYPLFRVFEMTVAFPGGGREVDTESGPHLCAPSVAVKMQDLEPRDVLTWRWFPFSETGVTAWPSGWRKHGQLSAKFASIPGAATVFFKMFPHRPKRHDLHYCCYSVTLWLWWPSDTLKRGSNLSASLVQMTKRFESRPTFRYVSVCKS